MGPSEYRAGKIKVTVTFSDWRDGKVIPATFEVEQGPNNPAPYEFAKDKENKDKQNKDKENKDKQNKDKENKDKENKDKENKDKENDARPR